MWFFRKRRRRKLLAEPMPAVWRRTLQEHMVHFRMLGPKQREKLENKARVFVAETHWEGCGGLELNDRMRILIAANACLLVLENEATLFESVSSVLVYPAGVVVPEHHQGNGIVSGSTPILGQARFNGPIILSWSDSIYASQHIGTRNVVLHEFAHAIDMLNGTVNGTPPMRKGLHERWVEVCQSEYEDFRVRLDHGAPGVIDPYAATNPGEFFAVVTEHFFEQPHVLHDHHPALWEIFGEYYGYSFGGG